jgi:hypothetical protein
MQLFPGNTIIFSCTYIKYMIFFSIYNIYLIGVAWGDSIMKKSRQYGIS